jgi:TonB family protein
MKTSISLVMCLALFSVAMSAKGEKSSTVFQPPQVISTVEPSYPPNTVTGGTVILKITVGPSGEVEDVQVLQQAKGFTQQAIKAVRKWTFEPAKLDGKPVKASIPVAFSFSQPIVWWNRKAK